MNEGLYLAAALRKWASSYVLKSSDVTELRKAIIAVTNGKKYISQRIADRHFEQFIRDPCGPQTRPLTTRGEKCRSCYGIMEEYVLRNNSEFLRFAIKQQVVAGPETAREQTTSRPRHTAYRYN